MKTVDILHNDITISLHVCEFATCALYSYEGRIRLLVYCIDKIDSNYYPKYEADVFTGDKIQIRYYETDESPTEVSNKELQHEELNCAIGFNIRTPSEYLCIPSIIEQGIVSIFIDKGNENNITVYGRGMTETKTHLDLCDIQIKIGEYVSIIFSDN